MRIDEENINHNVARLCSNASEEIWGIVLGEENAEERIVARLAYINGICDMADAMKAVLKIK